MSKETGRIVSILADTDGGWVNRRDAAEGLGRMAQGAIQGLKAHEKDSDRDVKSAVVSSLQSIGRALQGLDMSADAGGAPSLERMLGAMEKPGNRDLSKVDNGFSMLVVTSDGRTQTVLIEETTSNTKREIVRVSTICAKADSLSYEWALKNNSSMSHCALAVEERDGELTLVLINNLLADSLSYAELKLSVKEVAFYGDWVEDKLSSEDVH